MMRRIDCLYCENGITEKGRKCPSCTGRGFIILDIDPASKEIGFLNLSQAVCDNDQLVAPPGSAITVKIGNIYEELTKNVCQKCEQYDNNCLYRQYSRLVDCMRIARYFKQTEELVERENQEENEKLAKKRGYTLMRKICKRCEVPGITDCERRKNNTIKECKTVIQYYEDNDLDIEYDKQEELRKRAKKSTKNGRCS